MLQQFLLHCRIAKRTLEMVPRRKKAIRLLQLDNQPVDERDGFIMLKYKFSNAVYYTIGGHKLMGQQVIMQRPAPGQNIPFIVHGFSKKNDYVLSLNNNEVILTRVVKKSRFAESLQRSPQPYYSLSMVQN